MPHDRSWLPRIASAYDLTVQDYVRGIDPLASLPEEFRKSEKLAALLDDAVSCNSGAPENREFLDPREGLRFLDVGCAASLVNYDLGSWPSHYYGVDISPNLVEAMRSYAHDQGIAIGGLHVAEFAELPFDNEFFNIAAVIGVLEYCPFDYVELGLEELSRVIEPTARVVLDIPNPTSPHVETMLRLEEHLGQPAIVHSRGEFEQALERHFAIERADDSHVMLKYFLSRKSGRTDRG